MRKRKKMKLSHVSLDLTDADICVDEYGSDFNLMPMQNLFDTFPSKQLTLVTCPQPLSTCGMILRWLDDFDLLKYLLMLTSSVYDSFSSRCVCLKQFNKLIHLNNLIESFLNDFFHVSKTTGGSHSGIEYLLINASLTNCMLSLLADKQANTAATESAIKRHPPNQVCRFYSVSMRRLSKSIQALSILNHLINNLNKIVQLKEQVDETLLTLLDSVNQLQSLVLLLESAQSRQVIMETLSAPDGNMSNKYIDCLLNWLEFVIVEKYHLEEEEDVSSNTRCYMLNCLVEIFYLLTRSNKSNWRLPAVSSGLDMADNCELILTLDGPEAGLADYGFNLKRLNQYCSLLINSLSPVRVKSFGKPSNTLSDLIFKLKTVKAFMEPYSIILSQTKPELNNQQVIANNMANMSSFYVQLNSLNGLIDLFKKSLDKNLNLFFLKQYYLGLDRAFTRHKITIDYLNSSITILNIVYNLVDWRPSDELNNLKWLKVVKWRRLNSDSPEFLSASLSLLKYSFDSSQQFKAKRFLGHLISRNFMQSCLNLLNKLNDYLIFYSKPNKLLNQASNPTGSDLFSAFSTRSLKPEQVSLLIELVEPCVKLIEILMKTLINLRRPHFTDLTALSVLFRFYAVFNYCVQYSLSNSQTTTSLNERADLFNKTLLDIFVGFTQTSNPELNRTLIKTSLFTSFYRELVRFTIERPFNFVYGLNLLSELLPLPLPIPVPGVQDLSISSNEEFRMLAERKVLSDHLEPLFMRDKLKKSNLMFDESGSATNVEKTTPVFINLIRALSVTSAKSKCRVLMKRVCVQLCDLSESMCSLLIRCLLDYGIELLAVLKEDDDIETEPEMNVEDGLTLNGANNQSHLDKTHDENNANSMEIAHEISGDHSRSHIEINDTTIENNEMDSIYDTNLIDDSLL